MDEDGDEWQEHVEYETSTITVGRGTHSFPLHITQVAELPATANLFMLLEQSQRAAAGELNDTEISGKKVWAGSLLLCQYLCERAVGADVGLCVRVSGTGRMGLRCENSTPWCRA